jgi:uncharacterized integral membrane protein
MQLLLIFGIGFAIAAVMFALQNNALVAVSFALWRFESSLAIVLLLAMGLGVLIAGLVSSPTVIKGRWSATRLGRRVAELEERNAVLQQRSIELEAELARLDPSRGAHPEPPPDSAKPYVGLTALLTRGSTNSASAPKA